MHGLQHQLFWFFFCIYLAIKLDGVSIKSFKMITRVFNFEFSVHVVDIVQKLD